MTSSPALANQSRVAPDVTMSAARVLRAYLMETRYESLRMLRSLSFAPVFLCLPVLLYLLFGLVMFGAALRNAPNDAIGVFTGFSVFGIIGPALFGFGVTIAIEREQGLLRFKRALPMPAAAYLIAKLMMALVFAAVIMLSMDLAAAFATHLRLTSYQLLEIALLNIFGILPFCAIGMFIGTLVKGSAAPAFTNLVYLPMVYLSGLFFPLPHSLVATARIWPAYHLNQLVLSAAGIPIPGSRSINIVVLIAVTLLFALLSVKRLRRHG